MASFNTSAANLLQFSLLSICVQCTQNDWSKTVDKFTHYEEQSAFVMPHWLRDSTHCTVGQSPKGMVYFLELAIVRVAEC